MQVFNQSLDVNYASESQIICPVIINAILEHIYDIPEGVEKLFFVNKLLLDQSNHANNCSLSYLDIRLSDLPYSGWN